MENWDTDSDSQFTGKIFGGRGRGFSPANKDIYDSPKLGGSNILSEYHIDKENNEKGWLQKNKGKNNQEFKHGKNRDPLKQNDVNKDAKPKSKYIPQDPSEDDNEIFGNSISSGINFDKYDNFEVTISGENTPLSITNFETAGLRPFVIDVIKKCNYSKPTPIQKYAIPSIMNERDLMACAQTGSGKTAAYLIPVVNSLLQLKTKELGDSPCRPQAVIISPTRELTIQIFNEARKFSRGSFLKVTQIYGGTSIYHQLKAIENDCHILVATPGRLLDFVNRGKIEFFETRFLILDEADRMLDMGFFPDVKKVVSHKSMKPSGERQTLMFSATFPEEVQQLARTFLTNYIFLAIGVVGGACLDVQQKFFSLTKFEKRNKLVELLTEHKDLKCMIFVQQKRTTDFLATFLSEKNFPATSIHGDREQREREEALRDFRSGKMNILVATSVAARGLDIKNVLHVINFDLPDSVDEYVHRIGRTGRVGNCGMATSFYDPVRDAHLAPHLIRILRQAEQDIPDFLICADNEEVRTVQDHSNPTLGCAVEATYEEEVW